jgi:hypothetical protein
MQYISHGMVADRPPLHGPLPQSFITYSSLIIFHSFNHLSRRTGIATNLPASPDIITSLLLLVLLVHPVSQRSTLEEFIPLT